jgi:DNA-binding MarR family transcriptional regulator
MPSPDLPCACTALRKASRAVSRLYEEHMEGSGVTISQFAILRAIERGPGQALSRLAEAMVMDRTSLYRALEPMAREGWLAVEAGAGGRAKIARLTDGGRTVLREAAPHWAAAQAGFVEAFGRETWLELSQSLAGVVGAAAGARAP